MKRLVTVLTIIGITAAFVTLATGFGWAPYTYWGSGSSSSGLYYGSSGDFYGSSGGYLSSTRMSSWPSSSSGYSGYVPSSSTAVYVVPMSYCSGSFYPSSGTYYWPSSSSRRRWMRRTYWWQRHWWRIGWMNWKSLFYSSFQPKWTRWRSHAFLDRLFFAPDPELVMN